MNAALRKALAAAQLTETDVAAHVGVDPKTVRRWLSGTRPYPRHRWAMADLLRVDEDALWPQKSHQNRTDAPASEHVQRVYAHRWQVPREVWRNLFNSAEQEIGILVYSGLFLADDTGSLQILERKAREGVKTRILLGDPESSQVKERGWEESIGEALSAKIRNAIVLYRPLTTVTEIEFRLHRTTLYNSIYLTEKEILVNPHIYGLPASKTPVLLIDRHAGSEIVPTYLESFELAWSKAAGLINQ